MKVLMKIGAVALIAAHFLADFLFSLIFGEQIREYLYLLTPILFATCGVALIAFFGMVETVLRDFFGMILGCGVGLAVELSLSYPLIRSFAGNGASYVHLIASAAGSAIMLIRILYLVRRKGKESGT